jgi:hypothetical protein
MYIFAKRLGLGPDEVHDVYLICGAEVSDAYFAKCLLNLAKKKPKNIIYSDLETFEGPNESELKALYSVLSRAPSSPYAYEVDVFLGAKVNGTMLEMQKKTGLSRYHIEKICIIAKKYIGYELNKFTDPIDFDGS